ncbi:MAG: phosphohistidine phosphatase SixA [Planctomycetota bacterium]|jgi:phosphohistidine phosphatase
MRLYLVQHGQAHSEEVDPDRHLTERGAEDVKKLAAFLKPLCLRVKAIWHTGKARAAQTAELLAPALKATGKVEQRRGLAPNDAVEPIGEELRSLGRDLMIVGHMPFLGKLAAFLVARDSLAGVAAFQQGGLVCLELDESGRWRICWMLVPELLRSVH